LFDAKINEKIKEKALVESEEKYRVAFSASPDSVNINKLNGRYVEINDGFTRLMGYTKEDVIGVLSSEIKIWAILEDREKLIKILKEKGHVENLESVFRCKDGSLKTGLMSAHIINIKNEPHILTITRDISSRKKTEDALKKSNQRFRTYFEQGLFGMIITSVEKGFLEINNVFCKMFGYTREELFKLTWAEITHPDDLEADVTQFNRLLSGEIDSYSLEKRFIHKNKKIIYTSISVNAVRKSDGSVDYFLALMTDISKRKQAEEELYAANEQMTANYEKLKISENNLHIILNSIGDAVIATDIDGNILQMNPVAEKLTDWKLNDAKGKPLSEIFHIINAKNKKIVENPVQKVLDTGQIIGLGNHTMLISKNGIEYQISDSAAPIKNDEGKVMGVVLIFRDVTEEYQIQAALYESQENLQAFVENARGFGVYSVTLSDNDKYGARTLIASPSIKNILGVEDLKDNASWFKNIHNDDIERVTAAHHNSRKTGVVFDETFRIHHPTKHLRWIHTISSPIKLSGMNKEWYDYTGQDKSLPLTIERWTEVVHPDDLDNAVKLWMEHWETKTELELNFRLKRKDGVYRNFYCHTKPIFNEDGSFKHFHGYNIDITEQQQAIEALEITTKKLKDNYQMTKNAEISADFGFWKWTLQDNSIFWSDNMCRLHGIQPSEFDSSMEMVLSFYHPEDIDMINNKITQMLKEKKTTIFKYRIITPAKEVKYMLGTNHFTFDDKGEIIQLTGTLQNITKQEQIETALQERVKELECLNNISQISEQLNITLDDLLYKIVNEIPKGWHFSDIIGTRITINRKTYQTDNFLVTDRMQREDIHINNKLIGYIEICYLKEKPYQLEGPFLKEERILLKNIVRQIIWNIERKQLEETLLSERDNLVNIFNSMEDGVYIINQEYNIEYLNPVLEKDFGNYKDQKCYEYFHDRKEVCTWCKSKEVFAGKTVRWEWYSKKNKKYYDLIDTPIKNPDGTISKLEIFRDITNYKQADKKIQNLLSEKEIMLKEVHHRIKNNMTVIKSLLSMQSKTLNIPEAITSFQDAISRIETMEILYDKLYRSNNYNDVDINEYFTQLINEIHKIFPNYKSVEIKKQIDSFNINIKIISPLGIILNELITNTMKYAFPGDKQGLITISITNNLNHIKFIYTDNGIGIPKIDEKEYKGFGLKLVDILVRQLKGKYRIEKNNGTTFIIEFDI